MVVMDLKELVAAAAATAVSGEALAVEEKAETLL
jgi:hypothetical protein